MTPSWNVPDVFHIAATLHDMQVFIPALRACLPAHRRYIALPQAQFFVSDYAELWPETFMDEHSAAKL
jgi:hypothetical protein